MHSSLRDRIGHAIASVALACGRSATLLVLGIGLGMALLWALRQAVSGIEADAPLSSLAALTAFAAFASAIVIARRETPLPVRTFWCVALVAGMVLHAGYVLLAEPAWVSDFGRYWQIGVDLVRSPIAQVPTIYEQRALFLTVPVIELFGESRLALQLCNVTWLALIQICGYDLVRRVAGHSAAQAFCVLWIASCEPMLAAAIPSHDLFALVLLVAAFWLAVVGTRGAHAASWALRLVAGIVAGGLVAWLEALRGIGLLYATLLGLLAVTCIAVGALRSASTHPALPAWMWRAAQHALVAAVVAAIIGAMFVANGRTLDPDVAEVARIRHTAAQATSLSDGTWRFGRDFSTAFLETPGVDRAALADLRRALALSDLHAPLQKLASVYERMPRQYALGSQHPFYLTDTPPALRAFVIAYGHFHLLGFAALLLVALWQVLRAPGRDPAVTILLLFVTLLSSVLLLLGENQPRYIFPIWFVGAYAIATCLARGHVVAEVDAAAMPQASGIRRGVRETLGWTVTAAAVLAVSLVAAKALALLGAHEANGRILQQWQYASVPDGAAPGLEALQHAPPPRKAFAIVGRPLGPRSLKLMLTRTPRVEREVSASTELCGVTPGTTLDFFYHFPAKRLRIATPFTLAVDVQHEERWRTPLPDRTASVPVPVSLPLEPDADGCVALRFRLLANVDYDGVSWIEASYVEIIFPRLRLRRH